MNKSTSSMDLGFTQERFPTGIHVCLIFDRDDERQKVVSEYMAAGLRQGEQVRYFTDTTAPEKVRDWLSEIGVEIPEAKENGTFRVIKAENGYYPSGQFEPRQMISRILSNYELAKKAGYSGARSCGEMTWMLKDIPGAASERLIEYEVLLSMIDTSFPHSGMCQYDARLFDGATLFNVLKVHPWMVVRGKVVQNPYYISPQEFLKEAKLGRQ